MNKFFLIIIIILFVLLLSLAGYLAYQNLFLTKQGAQTGKVDEFAGWKTLKSDGFELKYPENFFDAGHEPKLEWTDCPSQYIDKTIINGVTYYHNAHNEGAAGHRYYYDLYAAQQTHGCLTIELDTSETNCNNYTPASTQQQDCLAKNEARPKILQQIVSTFNFTK